jgi:hypothetical protein
MAHVCRAACAFLACRTVIGNTTLRTEFCDKLKCMLYSDTERYKLYTVVWSSGVQSVGLPWCYHQLDRTHEMIACYRPFDHCDKDPRRYRGSPNLGRSLHTPLWAVMLQHFSLL